LEINKIECVLDSLHHKTPSAIPQIIGFTNSMAESKFLPYLDKKSYVGKVRDKRTRQSNNNKATVNFKKTIRIADLLDNFIVQAGSGGLKEKETLKITPKWYLVKWESGAIWRKGTAKNSWAREYIKYPVDNIEDLENLELPDPNDPERYENIEASIKYIVRKGFFPQCDINGFFSGVWYFLKGPLQVILKDIYFNRSLFEKLMSKIGKFNLEVEKNILERGAMMIAWVDDLGYNKETFMNPKVYERLIFPWHKKAINLAHKYGAFVNMHSHGNINSILPLLVHARLDVLNPVGPSDNMDLELLKEKYGDKICFQGGLSKYIGFMSVNEMKSHILDRIKIGSPRGGFILSSEGDIPYEMKPEIFQTFIKISRKYRRSISD
jgi:uroporphyrinogen-III decarboxylase